jgi:hypothetical protein
MQLYVRVFLNLRVICVVVCWYALAASHAAPCLNNVSSVGFQHNMARAPRMYVLCMSGLLSLVGTVDVKVQSVVRRIVDTTRASLTTPRLLLQNKKMANVKHT